MLAEDILAVVQQVAWDGLYDRGDQVASGIYIHRLYLGRNLLSRRMLLVRWSTACPLAGGIASARRQTPSVLAARCGTGHGLPCEACLLAGWSVHLKFWSLDILF